MAWNFADVWEAVAEVLPEAPALRHGDVVTSWSSMDRRADGVAAWLLALGVERGDTCAQYLYSGNEYVESTFGCFKVGVAPVNTNYRYAEDELAYLWGQAGCRAVVFHGTFADRVEALRAAGRVGQVRGWLWVDDGSGPCPDWADDYEAVAASAPGRVVAPWGRSPDDLWLLYTGGTTGLPKGVMWRQDDMFCLTNRTAAVRYPEDGDLDDVRRTLVKPGPVHVPAAPLMHGTGMITSFGAISSGGCIATLVGRRYDPTELLDLVEAAGVKSVAVVGDAFCRPLLAALDAQPRRWDLSSLRIITSSGVMWSQEVKDGLLRHHPGLILVDSLGSSEAVSMATSVATGSGGATPDTTTARFRVGPTTVVLDADHRPVAPGSGQVGVVAMGGRVPVGYYGDPEKSAATFPLVDGVRYSIPGDYATVDADGVIHLLGRGSQCINTGGEKVFPEEVEEALKTHPSVRDAAVVGVPDDRFGEVVNALVELVPGAAFDPDGLQAHVRAHHAPYKVPRRIVEVPSTERAANGKLDYKALRARLEATPS